MHRLVPDTLAGRIIVVLLVGLLGFHLGSLWLHQVGSQALLGSTRDHELAERLATARRALAELPAAERDDTAHALSSANLDLHWTPQRTIPALGTTGRGIAALAAQLAAAVPELAQGQVHLGFADEGGAPADDASRHALIGALQLPDQSWLGFSAALFRTPTSEPATLLSTSAMAVGVLMLSLVVVRIISRPLRDLAAAADRIGEAGPTVVVPEEGPLEVRHAAQAFNRMQARLDQLIADRTQALAAVSHDLRTPLARLRLRAGFLEDSDAQRQIDADLDEMEAMIGSTLAYLRGEAEHEARRVADVAAMLETLCDDATDAGRPAVYSGPSQARLLCRPVSLKRAFFNLIDNALKYGKRTRVTLEDAPDAITVSVDDDGPGISKPDLQLAFEPFRRLDASRNCGTGGSGLGLTIARQAIISHGGVVTLANRSCGGLRAVVRLPRAP